MPQINEAVSSDSTGGFIITYNGFAAASEDTTNSVGKFSPAPVAAAAYASTNYKNAGAATKANIKATPGSVFSIYITNVNAAVRYFQLHNKATAPAAADTAQLSLIIPAGTAAVPGVLTLTTNWFAYNETFTTGIGFAISTTDTTFTDSATANEHTVTVRYV